MKSQDKWTPVSEGLPKEKINPITNDFENVLCSTVWGDVRTYSFGKPRGCDKPHFWHHGIMDEYVIAWQYAPELYKKTHWTVTSSGEIIDFEGRVMGLI
jgi:hypothetical protein